MSKENIKKSNPTIEEMNEQLNEMSSEEFRRSFYAWFEDNGLVAELRKHLRRQMVESLRNTNLGVVVSQMHLTGSLKTQLINLLLAEYLVNMSYLFSLSVYSTEVPFISIFPECRSWLDERESANISQRRFTETKVNEILELLGFSTESDICKRLVNSYFQSEDNSLIICAVRLLSDLTKEKPKYKGMEDPNVAALNYEFLMKLEPWLKEIYTLLSNFELPSSILYEILTHLRNIFVREHEKIKLTETTNFNLLQAQIQKDLQKKEIEISNIITDLEKTFYEEKQKMLADFAKEQSGISETIENALKRETEYKKMLSSLGARERDIKNKEKEIADELETLKSRIKLLQDAYDTVLIENIKLTSMKPHNEGDIHESENREMIRLEYERLRREIEATKDALQQFNKTLTVTKTSKKDKPSPNDTVTKATVDYIRKENKKLIQKNELVNEKTEEFKNANDQLRSELALKTTEILAKEEKHKFIVDVSQVKKNKTELQKDVENLRNSNLKLIREYIVKILTEERDSSPRVAAIPTPPPPPPEEAPTPAPRQTLKAAGETLPPVTQPPPGPPAPTDPTTPTDYRKTVPSRLIVHSESDSSSHSPTDDVLQEARSRLRNLERASAEVENSYKAFRQRQLSGPINQQSHELTHKLRENTLRSHLLAQYNVHVPSIDMSKTASNTDQCAQSKIAFPLPKINLNDYFVMGSNVGNRYKLSKEIPAMNNKEKSATSCNINKGCPAGKANANVNASSSENCSSPANSVESSGLNELAFNLSMSSIDISSDVIIDAPEKSPVKE